MRGWLWLLLLCLPLGAQAVNRCLEPGGRLLFTDQPCPDTGVQRRPSVGAEHGRRLRELQQAVAEIEHAIGLRNQLMTVELQQLSLKRAQAPHHPAGATGEHNIGAERAAVTQKYKAMNDADLERLRQLRGELAQAQHVAAP